MKAFTVNESGAPPVLRDDLPEPTAGDGDVLVRVQASSANPIDGFIAAGALADFAEYVYPVTLGRDFAGVAERVGDAVRSVSAGDAVFGLVPAVGPTVHAGAWAELIALPESLLTRLPETVDVATAGAAGLAAVTANQCIDALDLSPGDSVLIVGAGGGVGSIAVQLAAAAGAVVIAPGLPEDESYLRELGVDAVLPRQGDVHAAVRERHPDGVDAIVDLVSYAAGAHDAVLRDGGRIASATGAAGEGPGRTNVNAMPSPEMLERVAGQLADGTVRIPVRRTYQLAEAHDALQTLATAHTQGKLALRIA